MFGSVITGLRKSYPRDKMEEISTSFCFICLLHLANEQGLRVLSSTDDSPEADIGEDPEDGKSVPDHKVGKIWELKVWQFELSFWQMVPYSRFSQGIQGSGCHPRSVDGQQLFVISPRILLFLPFYIAIKFACTIAVYAALQCAERHSNLPN